MKIAKSIEYRIAAKMDEVIVIEVHLKYLLKLSVDPIPRGKVGWGVTTPVQRIVDERVSIPVDSYLLRVFREI
jgi:hypothetical protein